MRPLLAFLFVVPLVAGCFASDPAEAEPPRVTSYGDGPVYPDDPSLSMSGRWSAPFDGEVPAINMVLLHTGEVLYWSGVDSQRGSPQDIPFLVVPPHEGEARVLSLASGTPEIILPGLPDGGAEDLFCSGQTILPDGRVLTAGGTHYHGGPNANTMYVLDGTQDARIFDPLTRNWTVVSDLLIGRWYPTLLTGPEGIAIAASGITSLTDPQEHWASWETYDVVGDSWSGVPGTQASEGGQLLPLYPRIFVVPGGPLRGDVFYSGVGALWTPFGEHPQQAEWAWQHSYDPSHDAWRRLGLTTYGARDYAPAVMLTLEPERRYAPHILSFGGAFYQSAIALPVAERTDLATDPPTVMAAAMLNEPRWHPNGVLLPDGKVLAVGGGDHSNVVTLGAPNTPVLSAELYDPQHDRWDALPAMSVPRIYHSTAILLPDGRVLVGGHVPLPQEPTNPVNPQIVETRLEIYEPGYLFRGERPVITAAPQAGTHGQTVKVTATGAVDSFVLVHPASTTHAFDSGQRSIRLPATASGPGVWDVTLPPDGFVAPPGHYMLFALTDHADGDVPSEAVWVHLT